MEVTIHNKGIVKTLLNIKLASKLVLSKQNNNAVELCDCDVWGFMSAANAKIIISNPKYIEITQIKPDDKYRVVQSMRDLFKITALY